MANHLLDLKGLANYADGTIDAIVGRQLQRIVADCEDRPGDDKFREVNIKIMVKPMQMQDGAVTTLHTEVEVSSKTPKYISRPVHCAIKHGGRAVFNDLAPDNANQRTLDETAGYRPDDE